MLKNPRKTQALLKTLEKTQGPQEKTQEPKIASKNPRSWEKTQAVATLLFSFKAKDTRSSFEKSSYRNRKLEIYRAHTKEKSREPAYSQARN